MDPGLPQGRCLSVEVSIVPKAVRGLLKTAPSRLRPVSLPEKKLAS